MWFFCLSGSCFCSHKYALLCVARLTTVEGANGNCSEDPVGLEEAQAEAVEMVVDRQASLGPDTYDDARPDSEDEQRGKATQVAAETISHRQEPCDENRKVSCEPSTKFVDGVEKDLFEKDLASLKPRIDAVKQKLVQDTKGFGVFRLEMLHASICRVLRQGHGDSCTSRLGFLETFIDEELNLL